MGGSARGICWGVLWIFVVSHTTPLLLCGYNTTHCSGAAVNTHSSARGIRWGVLWIFVVSHNTSLLVWIHPNTLLWRCCEHPQQRQRNLFGCVHTSAREMYGHVSSDCKTARQGLGAALICILETPFPTHTYTHSLSHTHTYIHTQIHNTPARQDNYPQQRCRNV